MLCLRQPRASPTAVLCTWLYSPAPRLLQVAGFKAGLFGCLARQLARSDSNSGTALGTAGQLSDQLVGLFAQPPEGGTQGPPPLLVLRWHMDNGMKQLTAPEDLQPGRLECWVR